MVEQQQVHLLHHVLQNEGIYLVNLFITDANGCESAKQIKSISYVSTTPSFSGITISDDEICLGQSTTITGVATPTPFIKMASSKWDDIFT